MLSKYTFWFWLIRLNTFKKLWSLAKCELGNATFGLQYLILTILIKSPAKIFFKNWIHGHVTESSLKVNTVFEYLFINTVKLNLYWIEKCQKLNFLCVPVKNQLVDFGIKYGTSSSMLIIFISVLAFTRFKIEVIMGLKNYKNIIFFRPKIT